LRVASAYDFGLIGESEQQLKADYETHIISLLGHLFLHPHQTAPEKIFLTASERAMVEIAQDIDSRLAQGKRLAVVYAGNKDQTTLIGGRQLWRDSAKRGSCLDLQTVMHFLKNHDDLDMLIHKDNNDEGEECDAIIALASLMNDRKNMIGFGVDTDRTNIFIRALTKDAQRRMALIIPNGSENTGEYDVCMEGEGDVYTHMLPNCRVYKCATPEHQAEIIEKVYQDMMPHCHHVIQ